MRRNVGAASSLCSIEAQVMDLLSTRMWSIKRSITHSQSQLSHLCAAVVFLRCGGLAELLVDLIKLHLPLSISAALSKVAILVTRDGYGN